MNRIKTGSPVEDCISTANDNFSELSEKCRFLRKDGEGTRFLCDDGIYRSTDTSSFTPESAENCRSLKKGIDELPENADLNDYFAVGQWYTVGAGRSLTLANMPSETAGRSLYVTLISEEIGHPNIVMQTLETANRTDGVKIWTRYRYKTQSSPDGDPLPDIISDWKCITSDREEKICRAISCMPGMITLLYSPAGTNKTYTAVYNGAADSGNFLSCEGTVVSLGGTDSGSHIRMASVTGIVNNGFAALTVDAAAHTLTWRNARQLGVNDYALCLMYENRVLFLGNDYIFTNFGAGDYYAQSKQNNLYSRTANIISGKISINTSTQKAEITGLRLQIRKAGGFETAQTCTVDYSGIPQPTYLWYLFYNASLHSFAVYNFNSIPFIGTAEEQSWYLVCSFFNSEFMWVPSVRKDTYFIDGRDCFGTVDIRSFMNNGTCRIFRKVTCIGDSYTAGYVCEQNPPYAATSPNIPYSWPHYMELITGCKYVNCGIHGKSVLSWMTDGGLDAMRAAGKSQAYIIGFMINDTTVERGEPLGSTDDIEDESPSTFYGGLSNIIRTIYGEFEENEEKPFVFVQTIPVSDSEYDTRYGDFIQAVYDVAEYYADAGYRVHCLDLYANRYLYSNDSLTSDKWRNHYTPAGYEQFAEILSHIMSGYINSNIKSFQEVYKIPYDNTGDAYHTSKTVTLPADGWNGTTKTQSVSVTGVTADNTVQVSPVPSDISEYAAAQIVCTSQSANSLTFTAETVPADDISVNVVIWG